MYDPVAELLMSLGHERKLMGGIRATFTLDHLFRSWIKSVLLQI